MTELRRQLRTRGITYRVVKNRLAIRAATSTGRVALTDLLQGPTGIAFSQGDPVDPAKAIMEYARSAGKELPFTGAVADEQSFTGDQVQQLARLPSREILLGQLLGGLQSPLAGLVYVLGSHMRGLLGILQARQVQLETGEEKE